MSQIILMAETGSDIPADLAKKGGIELVPMHVSFGDTTKDDGSFPPSDVVTFYKETGILPKTSGSVPEDFTVAFDRIHAAHPDAQIMYLAYSAVTTCSYQSAQIASEERDYVKSLDYTLNDEGKEMDLYDSVGYNEKEFDPMILDLRNEIEKLDPEDRKLINLRYYQDKSQQETSRELGINQVQVSRRENKILVKLNQKLAS